MKKLLIFIWGVLLLLSCETDHEEAYLSVKPTSITFSYLPSEDVISVNSNIEFHVNSSQEWCKANKTGSQLIIKVTENENAKQRTAVVTVFAEEVPSIDINITQNGTNPVFTVDYEDLIQQFSSEKESRLFRVETNIDFEVKSTEGWCKAEVLNSSKHNLQIAVDKNNEISSREAELILSANGFDDIVMIVEQEGFLPNKQGMKIKGWVSCNDVGVPNVVVSDGHDVTKTDENGVYYLPSDKRNRFVFVSIPGNYEVANKGKAPQFFKKLSGNKNVVERHDFELFKTDNNDHIVLTMADIHLAKRVDDLAQFETFLKDINENITKYELQGKKVYGLTLGDLSWDTYWYTNNFTIKDYVPYMNKINAPVFNTMGNHDNDPYGAGDWAAEQYYCDIIGPNYYSFNLGKVHYVVLDDIVYHNKGGGPGVVGERNYDGQITAEQADWLENDLNMIEDKTTPVVVALHIPVFSAPNIHNSSNYRITNTKFHDALSKFSEVHIVSGHSHINWNYQHTEALMEHNTAAVCATWWWTGNSGYSQNHICKDGSVGGYGVWDMNNKSVKWHYKSMGYDHDYQFRTYDLNTIEITAEKYAPNANEAHASQVPTYAGDYATKKSNNEVLINIWGYDIKWKISVKEEGKELPVTRVNAKDPLHIISYELARLNRNATPSSTFSTSNTSHMFKVKASSPTSTLEIDVTDRFGRTYSEIMTRPKELTTKMK